LAFTSVEATEADNATLGLGLGVETARTIGAGTKALCLGVSTMLLG
jgi:hypothetical protein